MPQKSPKLVGTSASRSDPQPYLDLGSLLLRGGKPAEALDPLEHAVLFGPHNPLAHQLLGLALEALGRYQEAVSPLQLAAALAPAAEQPTSFWAASFAASAATPTPPPPPNSSASHSNTATPNTDTLSELSPNLA